MARNFMETERPNEIQQNQAEAVDLRMQPRQSELANLNIPEPKLEVEDEKFKPLFDPKYALQPENYPNGGIQGFYNASFDRLKSQEARLPNASASEILAMIHNNTVLGACTEYRCSKVAQRHIANENMKNDGYLEC